MNAVVNKGQAEFKYYDGRFFTTLIITNNTDLLFELITDSRRPALAHKIKDTDIMRLKNKETRPVCVPYVPSS